jgi:hypothetical protein
VFENPQQQHQVKKIQLNIPDAIVHEPQKETEHSEMGTVDGAGICIFCKSFGRLLDIFDFLLI